MHSYSPDVTEPTCVQILQPGYKVGDRILRPARVAVAEPGEAEDPTSQAETARRETTERRSDARPNRRMRPARRRHAPRVAATRTHEEEPVEHQGLPREGLLQGPRRHQGREPPTRSRSRTASSPASTTRTPTRATPSAEERFKEISEAYNVLSDDKRRKEYDEARSLFGGGVRMPGQGGGGGYGVRPRRPVRRPAGAAAPAAARRPARRRCSAAAAAAGHHPAAAAARRGRRDRGLADASATRSTASTVSLRLTGEGPCQACTGTGAKAGTVPQGLPDLRGHRPGQPEPGQLRVLRALQDLPGPRPGGRRPVPGVLGQRARA